MLRLLLIRHGVTEWNDAGRLMGRAPIGLARHGRQQIERLSDSLATTPIDAIFSSPQPRTQETAAILAAPHRVDVQVEPELDEVWLSSAWQGRTFNDLRADPDLIAMQSNPEHTCEFIEPIAQVQKRVVAAVDLICSTRAAGTIALVSHGDPLRVLVAHLLSLPLSEYRRLIINTGSLSVVDRGQGKPRLVLLSWKPGGTLQAALAPAAG